MRPSIFLRAQMIQNPASYGDIGVSRFFFDNFHCHSIRHLKIHPQLNPYLIRMTIKYRIIG